MLSKKLCRTGTHQLVTRFQAKQRAKFLDHRVVAKVEKNTFRVNPNNYFYLERPDPHTLIVHDQEDRIALYLRYLNPTAIKVRGTFYIPGIQPIVISEEKQTFEGTTHIRSCFQGFIRAAIAIK